MTDDTRQSETPDQPNAAKPGQGASTATAAPSTFTLKPWLIGACVLAVVLLVTRALADPFGFVGISIGDREGSVLSARGFERVSGNANVMQGRNGELYRAKFSNTAAIRVKSGCYLYNVLVFLKQDKVVAVTGRIVWHEDVDVAFPPFLSNRERTERLTDMFGRPTSSSDGAIRWQRGNAELVVSYLDRNTYFSIRNADEIPAGLN